MSPDRVWAGGYRFGISSDRSGSEAHAVSGSSRAWSFVTAGVCRLAAGAWIVSLSPRFACVSGAVDHCGCDLANDRPRRLRPGCNAGAVRDIT